MVNGPAQMFAFRLRCFPCQYQGSTPLHLLTEFSLNPHRRYVEADSTALVIRSTLWELKVHTLPSQPPIHLGVGIKTVVHTTALLLVEHDLEDLAAIFTGTDALADNLDRVDEVGEDGVVDGSERAGAGALLRLRRAAPVAAFWAWQDAAGGDDQDVAVGEFLLEFAGEAGEVGVSGMES